MDFFFHNGIILIKLTVETPLFRHHVLEAIQKAVTKWTEATEIGRVFYLTCGCLISIQDLATLNADQYKSLSPILIDFGITSLSFNSNVSDILIPYDFYFAG